MSKKFVISAIVIILVIVINNQNTKVASDKRIVEKPSPTFLEPTLTMLPTPSVDETWSDGQQNISPLPTDDNYYPSPTDIPNPTSEPYYLTSPTPTEYNDNQQTHQPSNKSCYTSGDYTFCSDGSSFITNGDYTSVNGSDGKSGSCITSGSYTSCSDGSSAIKSGNTSFYNGNGQSGSCTRNGSFVNCSDGSTSYSP